MEKVIDLHIEKLPEGFYLATSESIQGLIAQAERSPKHSKSPEMWQKSSSKRKTEAHTISTLSLTASIIINYNFERLYRESLFY